MNNLLVFRFANTFAEAFWNRHYIESVQITMAEDFGVQGRGAFYDKTGAIRDVIQNHLFQVLSNLAMEPPARLDSESIRDEKVKVLKAIPSISEKDLVRGQFHGYRDENGVAKDSEMETFAALKLEINSWRWKGVPFYIRAGKCLPVTCTEIVGRFRKPPSLIPADALKENHLRLRLGPDVTIAMGMGDATLFAREDYVEEAWRIVDPVLETGTPIFEYEANTWGPNEADRVTPVGGWHNPTIGEEAFAIARQAA